MSMESQGCSAAVSSRSSPIKLEPGRVKKERQREFAEDEQSNVVERRVHLQHRLQSGCASATSFANGFQSGSDLLQDILKASKLSNLAHHTSSAKHEKVRLIIEESLSEESRSRVQDIFSQIDQLKLEEKLLLYLKLPLSLSNSNSIIDPLRQPLNPLGNRYEIHQTIMWIKTHLEEDPEVSLPKQEVYDEYNMFCSKNSMKPLSTADFGKVMKQVYPRVRPRRLGTRGNSRYCYAGMRKRIKLDPPSLPSTSGTDINEAAECNITEEMLGAASTLIREWAENLLDTKFPTLSALGKYLVNNLFVDSQSLAAVCILSASEEPQSVTNKDSGSVKTPVTGKIGRLREAQLQLQKKLEQRECTRYQKNHNHESIHQESLSQEKNDDQNSGSIAGSNRKIRKGKINVNNLAQGTNMLNKINATAVVSVGRQKKVVKSNNQICSVPLQSNCDNFVVQLTKEEEISNVCKLGTNDSATSLMEEKSKFARKRASSSAAIQTLEISPEKHMKIDGESVLGYNSQSANSGSKLSSTPTLQSAKLSVILASNLKVTKSNKTTGEAVATFINQPLKSCDKEVSLCSKNFSKANGYASGSVVTCKTNALMKNETNIMQGNMALTVKEKLGSIDSDSLNDYLNGGNNSQEQEEELLQYFQQSNSSSSDMEHSGVVISEPEPISRQDKVSQLRIILQENLKDSVLPMTKTRQQSAPVDKQQNLQKHNLILPTLLNHNNIRRRVSFETNIIEYSQDSSCSSNNNVTTYLNNTVPQSPNTRRRIFNFTPISPGPHSPINGRVSKSSSANASPFVSPRNTPVPRSKSNLQGHCRSRNSHKTVSRSTSCNVPCSTNRNDIFIVPTSGSEYSRTPNSPLATINNKASQAQLLQSIQGPLQKRQTLSCASFLSDLTSQQPQLLINYPSQENLQEIKNVYQNQQQQQPTDQEISDLFKNERHLFGKDQMFYRSQSVPVHRMVNPALLSPIPSHHLTPIFFNNGFNPSTSSSIAPTPVPSEFNDFGSIGQTDNSNYLLDPLISEDENFLIEGKEVISGNLNNIFDILTDGEPEILTEEATDKDKEISTNSLNMDTFSHTNVNNDILLTESTALLNSWTNENNTNNDNTINSEVNNALKHMHSRSYPNTPLPLPNSSFIVQYPVDSSGSRSYPTTPLHNLLQQSDTSKENNEPMLFSPTLNCLNLHSQNININNSCTTNVECNVADLLERNLINDDTDDLGSLGNFDGLQDVDTLSPLFNEVVELNH